MIVDKVKVQIRNKVNKEFKEFQNQCFEKGVLYTFNQGLKVAFYKEIRTFVLNGIVTDHMVLEMSSMEEILLTLWKRYELNVVQSSGDHFLEQLIDFHCHNLNRVKQRLGDNA